MRQVALLWCAVFCAGPALACPVAEDLTRGVEITFADAGGDPFVLTYFRRGDGAVLEVEDYGEGEVGYIASAGGILETEYYVRQDGAAPVEAEITRYAYDFEIEKPLTPYSSHSGVQTEWTGQDDPIPTPVRVNVLGAIEIAFGECAYQAVETQTYYYRDGGYLLIEQAYIADWGAAIVMGYAEPEYDDLDRYTPVSLRVRP